MSKPSFEQLTEKIQQHFVDQNYQEGLSLASKHMADFPDQFAMLNYWRICLAARLNEFTLANKILESTLASGIWYSDTLLRQSPSLEPMQGQAEFEQLVVLAEKMRSADGLESIPLLVARPENACGPGAEGCPALIFLHGNSDTAQKNLEHWHYLSTHGWLIAFPQSSQALWAGSYMWSDYETTKEEIDRHYHNLTKQYRLDSTQLILGGFSMGGEMALELVLSGAYPARGFILLGPGGTRLDQISEWQPLIEKAKGKGLRGVIWMGLADDTIPQENIRQLVKMFNEGDIACKLVTFPGLEHAYPADFEQVASEAIEFILASD